MGNSKHYTSRPPATATSAQHAWDYFVHYAPSRIQLVGLRYLPHTLLHDRPRWQGAYRVAAGQDLLFTAPISVSNWSLAADKAARHRGMPFPKPEPFPTKPAEVLKSPTPTPPTGRRRITRTFPPLTPELSKLLQIQQDLRHTQRELDKVIPQVVKGHELADAAITEIFEETPADDTPTPHPATLELCLAAIHELFEAEDQKDADAVRRYTRLDLLTKITTVLKGLK